MQPWRAETFKFSTDPELVAKVTDVVGLYLAPPENAIVLCVDEKSQIQALDRTAADAADAARAGRAAHPRLRPARHLDPVRRAGDRHRQGHRGAASRGTATRSSWPSSSRSPAPTPTGELHLVMDNYAAHKHAEVTRLARGEPADPRALHPDLRVLAEPGRGLVRHHRTPSHPPRHLHAPSATSTPRSAPSSTAGTTAATPSSGPRPPTRSSRKPTVRRPQTRGTRCA